MYRAVSNEQTLINLSILRSENVSSDLKGIWHDFVPVELGFDPSYLYKSAAEEEEMAKMNDLERETILNDRHLEAAKSNDIIRHAEQ